MAASSSGSSPILGLSPFSPVVQEGQNLFLLGKDPARATEKNLETYAIAVKSFKEPSFWSKLIGSSDVVSIRGRVDNKNVKYNISVKTVARQLHLTESKVREIAQKVDGIDTLRRHAAILQVRKNTPIKSKYQGLAIQSFKVGRARYFINTETQDIYKSRKFAEGSFGKVFKISSLVQPESPMLALKKAKRKIEKSTEDLQKEDSVLQKINPFGDIPGIQKPPKLVSGSIYTSHLYDGDLINMVTDMTEFEVMQAKDKLKLLGELIVGLTHLHKSGYFHGDIKPGNCLIEKDKTGENKIARAVLSDFGGVHEVETWDNRPNFTCTSHYLAPEVLDLNPQKDPYPANLLQSSDVYALCKTIAEILLVEEIGEAITLAQYEKLKRIIPEELAQVISQGMTTNPTARPTSSELFDQFQEAFKGVYKEDFI